MASEKPPRAAVRLARFMEKHMWHETAVTEKELICASCYAIWRLPRAWRGKEKRR